MSLVSDIKPTASGIRLFTWALVIAWTVALAASLGWNVFQVKDDIQEAARIQSRSAFGKDVIYRRWNALHGGVYVPITEQTQPNPYLTNVPERDIQTPSGKQLTLMNPAYMTRQVFELGQAKHGVRAHITSLKPIRPENAADSWETNALQAFEQGTKEVSAVETLDGQPYLRLMRPLLTEKRCLLCHAQQGYQENDIRGGISVAIPMQPLQAISRATMTRLASLHAILWLLGLGGIAFGAGRLNRSDAQLRQAEAALQQSCDGLGAAGPGTHGRGGPD